MDAQKEEEIIDTALKLDKIRMNAPNDYFYLKGWIHCLSQKTQKNKKQVSNLMK